VRLLDVAGRQFALLEEGERVARPQLVSWNPGGFEGDRLHRGAERTMRRVAIVH